MKKCVILFCEACTEINGKFPNESQNSLRSWAPTAPDSFFNFVDFSTVRIFLTKGILSRRRLEIYCKHELHIGCKRVDMLIYTHIYAYIRIYVHINAYTSIYRMDGTMKHIIDVSASFESFLDFNLYLLIKKP